MKKIALFIVVVMVMGLFSSPAIASSDTIGPAVWASEAATYLKNFQLIPSELFSNYDSPIRRDEFAAVLMGIYNEACQNYYTFPDEPNIFADTESNKYLTEIKKANVMGIINGTSETTFSPDKNITREDTATLIFRLIKLMYPQENAVSNIIIADRNQISKYALSSVEFCMNNEIMNGTGNGMFSPKGMLTRQEAMVLMHNICARYKVIENGRGSAITELKPVIRGHHEMVYDGDLYIRVYPYPFNLNNTIEDSAGYSLIRTPLDQSQKNKGEILFSHVNEIYAYTVNKDNIFFCDRSPDRAVYSTDKNGKNIKLLYNLSEYTRSDFDMQKVVGYMHVDGDWLFIGTVGMLFKMRTDGTCLSIIHSGYGGELSYQAERKNIYMQDGTFYGEFRLSRVSMNGDKTELLYRNKNFDNDFLGAALFNNKIYTSVLENGMEWETGVPLIEIDVPTRNVKQIKILVGDEFFIKSDDGIYLYSIDNDKLHLKNITGGSDISVAYKSEMDDGYATKYGDYLYFSALGNQPYPRYHYLYNISTGMFTDAYGNPVS